MDSRNKKGWLAVLGCSMGIFWSGTLIFAFPGLLGPYWRDMFAVGPAETGRIMTFVLIFGAIFTAYGFVGGMVGPALSGMILRWSGGNYAPVFLYLGIFCALAAVCVMLANPRTQKQDVAVLA
jgi:OFA family oxalate/formate antiporter-like MFS transporter